MTSSNNMNIKFFINNIERPYIKCELLKSLVDNCDEKEINLKMDYTKNEIDNFFKILNDVYVEAKYLYKCYELYLYFGVKTNYMKECVKGNIEINKIKKDLTLKEFVCYHNINKVSKNHDENMLDMKDICELVNDISFVHNLKNMMSKDDYLSNVLPLFSEKFEELKFIKLFEYDYDEKEFKTKFDNLTFNLLDDVDYKYFCVAGGSILESLSSKSINEDTDIDIFVYDCHEYIINKILKHFELIGKRMNKRVYYGVKSNVINISIDNVDRIFQIIYTDMNSKFDVVEYFDFDYIQFLYDGDTVFCTPRALKSLKSKITKPTNKSFLKIHRIAKAINKGYELNIDNKQNVYKMIEEYKKTDDFKNKNIDSYYPIESKSEEYNIKILTLIYNLKFCSTNIFDIYNKFEYKSYNKGSYGNCLNINEFKELELIDRHSYKMLLKADNKLLVINDISWINHNEYNVFGKDIDVIYFKIDKKQIKQIKELFEKILKCVQKEMCMSKLVLHKKLLKDDILQCYVKKHIKNKHDRYRLDKINSVKIYQYNTSFDIFIKECLIIDSNKLDIKTGILMIKGF